MVQGHFLSKGSRPKKGLDQALAERLIYISGRYHCN